MASNNCRHWLVHVTAPVGRAEAAQEPNPGQEPKPVRTHPSSTDAAEPQMARCRTPDCFHVLPAEEEESKEPELTLISRTRARTLKDNQKLFCGT